MPVSRYRPRTNPSPPMLARLFILCSLMVFGCGIPQHKEWPVLRVCVDQGSRDFVSDSDIRLFSRRLGYRVEVREVVGTSVVKTLSKDPPADLVIVSSEAAWDTLVHQDLVAEERFRFAFRRDRLIYMAGEGKPHAAERYSPLGRLTKVARRRYLPRHVSDEAVREVHPRQLYGFLLDSARGDWPGGYYAESWLDGLHGSPEGHQLLDPWPGVSMQCWGAVLAGSTRPEAADALWNHLERSIRRLRYGFIPVMGPTPSREYWLRGAIL